MAHKKRAPSNGCGFLMLTCLVTCVFLLFNVVLTTHFYPVMALHFEWLADNRITQLIMYVAPILMVFFEWWIVDLISDLVAAPRRKTPD